MLINLEMKWWRNKWINLKETRGFEKEWQAVLKTFSFTFEMKRRGKRWKWKQKFAEINSIVFYRNDMKKD